VNVRNRSQEIDTQGRTRARAHRRFNLMIDALKLNGLTTIYGVPESRSRFRPHGASRGIRVISFRHEQNAGNAASIAAS